MNPLLLRRVRRISFTACCRYSIVTDHHMHGANQLACSRSKKEVVL